MNKVEGWDCGTHTHLHQTEVDAQKCLDERERRKQHRLAMTEAERAGWTIGSTHDGWLLAVKGTEGRALETLNREAETEFLRGLK